MVKFISSLAVVLGFCAAAVAADEKFVKLVNPDTGKVLGITDSSDDAGVKAVLAKDDNSKSQHWKLVKDGEFYKLVNRKSGKVLDVEGESMDEGGNIIQWDDKDEGNDNQRWAWEGTGKTRRLKSKSSNLVLDISADKTIIQQKSDGKSKSQLWEIVEVKE